MNDAGTFFKDGTTEYLKMENIRLAKNKELFEKMNTTLMEYKSGIRKLQKY